MPRHIAFAFALALVSVPLSAGAAAKTVDVAIRTAQGTIVVRLEAAKAPVTVRNFLKYVDAKMYDNSTFYRSIASTGTGPRAAPGILQGGLERSGRKLLAPIAVETTSHTGLHNVNGAIAMARTSDPNSATSEFFICVGDDSYLDSDRQPDGKGYAVFGEVVRGFDVVLKIQHSPTEGDQLIPPVKILSVRRTK